MMCQAFGDRTPDKHVNQILSGGWLHGPTNTFTGEDYFVDTPPVLD
jgi:hypothetical protein